jgi:hypothetical protein
MESRQVAPKYKLLRLKSKIIIIKLFRYAYLQEEAFQVMH